MASFDRTIRNTTTNRMAVSTEYDVLPSQSVHSKLFSGGTWSAVATTLDTFARHYNNNNFCIVSYTRNTSPAH